MGYMPVWLNKGFGGRFLSDRSWLKSLLRSFWVFLGLFFVQRVFGCWKDTISFFSFSKKFLNSIYFQNTIGKNKFWKKIFDSKSIALYTYELIVTYFPIRVCACVYVWQKNRSILVYKCY